MTLINGASSNSNFERDIFPQIQALLQTNNDVVMAIHKSFVESTSQINQRMNELQDQILEVKRLFLQKTEQGVTEEATKWRAFTESLISRMTEQHNKDNTMLTELLKLSISESAKGGQPSQVAQHVSVPTTSPAIQVPQQSQLAQPKQVVDVQYNKASIPTTKVAEQPKPKISETPQIFAEKQTAVRKVEQPATKVAEQPATKVVEQEIAVSNNQLKSTFGGGNKAPIVSFSFGNISEVENTAQAPSLPVASAAGQTKPIFGSSSSSFFQPAQSKIFGPNSNLPSFGTVADQAPKGGSFLSNSTAGSAPFGKAQDFKLFQTASPKAEKAKDNEGHSGDEAEEFVPNAHYEPVIPLPDLVEVKTGEEEEEVLFVGRCKLFRFDSATKENKERGVGEIKLLRNKNTDRYRCLMRRDQVHKICANFTISENFKITQRPNTPAVYTWNCMDYSDNSQGIHTILHAKFRDKDMAKQFSDKVTEIVEILSNK